MPHCSSEGVQIHQTEDTMKARNAKTMILLAACGVLAPLTQAATYHASWVGPASGVYNDPANWTTNVVPDNGTPSATAYYNVIVNKPGGAIVGVNVPAEVLNLTIGAGSIFVPQSEKEFTLIGTAAHGSCSINNAGTLGVTQAIPYSRLTLNGSTTNLTGGGTLSILNGIVSGTSTLVNTNNTIVGRGYLGYGSLGLINHATIIGRDLNNPGQTLYVEPGSAGMTNTGTILASQGNLFLIDGSYNNTNGYIAALDGVATFGSGASISGGIIHAANLGTVMLNSANILGSTLTAAGAGRFRVSANSTATIMDVTNSGAFIINNGGTALFAGTNANNGTISLPAGIGVSTLRVGSGITTTFNGFGKIVLEAGGGTLSSGQIVGNGTLVNTAPHTISGAGTLGIGSTTILNSGTITASGGTLRISPAAGSIGLVSTGSLLVNAGAAMQLASSRNFDSTGGRLLVGSTGTLQVNGTLSAGSINLFGTINVAAALNAGNVDGIGSLNLTSASSTATIHRFRGAGISSSGTLTIAGAATPDAVSRMAGAPQFAGSGRLDLNDNALICDYTVSSPLQTIRSQLAAGYSNGSWTGPQLTSSTAAANDGFALGYAESSALFASFPAIFKGQSVDSTTVVVSYTRWGDANLDGVVDITDLGALATNWQGSGVWTSGDFNFDGFVDITDLGILATNWQGGVGSAAPGVDLNDALSQVGLHGSAVPEPSCALVLGAGLLLRRRTREG